MGSVRNYFHKRGWKVAWLEALRDPGTSRQIKFSGQGGKILNNPKWLKAGNCHFFVCLKFVFHRNREQDDRQNNQELIMANPIMCITGRRHYCAPVSRNGVCVSIFLPCLDSQKEPRPPIVEVPQSYSDTPHSEGLLGTSDQPDA
jgi:hypothetical protein